MYCGNEVAVVTSIARRMYIFDFVKIKNVEIYINVYIL